MWDIINITFSPEDGDMSLRNIEIYLHVDTT